MSEHTDSAAAFFAQHARPQPQNTPHPAKQRTMSGELRLTPREVEVCCLVASGETDKAIGKVLGIGPRTVEWHMNAAARKIHSLRPHLFGRPRRVILGFYVECYGVAAFERRREERAA